MRLRRANGLWAAVVLAVLATACSAPPSPAAAADPADPAADPRADGAGHDAADVPAPGDAPAAVSDAAADSAATSDADAGPPGVCFKGAPPQADAFVADVPQPPAAACAPPSLPPTWFADAPPATLALVLGTGAADGQFVPASNGDWTVMAYGAQGGFHVWAGFKTLLPGHTEPKVTMDVQIWSEIGCVKVGTGLGTLVSAVQLADGSYSNVFPGSPGVADAFYVLAALSWQYCGQWVTLHVRAHLPGTTSWGEAQVTLRLYDSKT